jgi:hypothetical protein
VKGSARAAELVTRTIKEIAHNQNKQENILIETNTLNREGLKAPPKEKETGEYETRIKFARACL